MVRKSGLWSHYSLAPAKTPFHRKLLECLAKCFGEVPELQADEARATKIRKSGGWPPLVLMGLQIQRPVVRDLVAFWLAATSQLEEFDELGLSLRCYPA